MPFVLRRWGLARHRTPSGTVTRPGEHGTVSRELSRGVEDRWQAGWGLRFSGELPQDMRP